MKGLTNPDKLETLWEHSKTKRLRDDSQNKTSVQLDQYLSKSHLAEDSISIEDYISRWCNIIQNPNSPTPQENHRTAQLFSSEELDNLDKYNQFINELAVRIEGGWSPADTLPYIENLLRLTLGLSPQDKTNEEFYPDSDQAVNRSAIQPDSDKKAEFDKESTPIVITKGEL